MEYGSQIARGDVAVVQSAGRAPSRLAGSAAPHLGGRGRRDAPGRCSRDGHKEEERQRGAASQREDTASAQLPTAACGDHAHDDGVRARANRRAHTITSAKPGPRSPTSDPSRRRGAWWNASGRLSARRGRSHRHGSPPRRGSRERARLQRDGECVEASALSHTSVVPSTSSVMPNRVSGKSRNDEQEFGVHAAQESHGGTIGKDRRGLVSNRRRIHQINAELMEGRSMLRPYQPSPRQPLPPNNRVDQRCRIKPHRVGRRQSSFLRARATASRAADSSMS